MYYLQKQRPASLICGRKEVVSKLFRSIHINGPMCTLIKKYLILNCSSSSQSVMMNETGTQRILPDHLSGSGRSFGTPRHQSIIEPILSKRVCFYKSGDPQFSGLRMVINNRTFKTFDALLDSLSKKVPLLFGVRNITTPRGVHAVHTLDELEDGKSYICSDSRNVKPINLALAQKKLLPWYHARPVSSRRQTVQQARLFPGQNIHKKERAVVRTPKRLLVYRNGVPTVRHTVVLDKRTTPTFESILEYISELIQFHVVKLHTPEGRRVSVSTTHAKHLTKKKMKWILQALYTAN